MFLVGTCITKFACPRPNRYTKTTRCIIKKGRTEWFSQQKLVFFSFDKYFITLLLFVTYNFINLILNKTKILNSVYECERENNCLKADWS